MKFVALIRSFLNFLNDAMFFLFILGMGLGLIMFLASTTCAVFGANDFAQIGDQIARISLSSSCVLLVPLSFA